MFINPRLWVQHSAILEEAITEYLAKGGSFLTEQNTQALDQTFIDLLADVQKRNNAMLFRDLPPRILGLLSSALTDIKVCLAFWRHSTR